MFLKTRVNQKFKQTYLANTNLFCSLIQRKLSEIQTNPDYTHRLKPSTFCCSYSDHEIAFWYSFASKYVSQKVC